MLKPGGYLAYSVWPASHPDLDPDPSPTLALALTRTLARTLTLTLALTRCGSCSACTRCNGSIPRRGRTTVTAPMRVVTR